MNRVLGFAVASALATFTAIIIWLGYSARSATETALASVLLTLVSVVATWVVSHFYYVMATSREIERVSLQHDESLKTYARKAAEKVTNLSHELDRLSIYLREYLEYNSDGDSLDVVLSVRDERISSAVHIVEILRSVNDTSLSDWQGVIGEELEKKKEQEEQIEARKEEILIETVDRLDQLLKHYETSPKQSLGESRIISKIEEMRDEFTTVALGLGGGRPSSSPLGFAKTNWSLPCPSCQRAIGIGTRRGKVLFKTRTCPSCHERLVIRPLANGEPMIERRGLQEETVICPKCGSKQNIFMENISYATAKGICNNCNLEYRASRKINEIVCKPINADIDTIFVKAVRESLPPQPWPKGIHTEIAAKLGANGKEVQKAIQSLIAAGIFKPQIDGIVYEPVPQAKPDHAVAPREINAS